MNLRPPASVGDETGVRVKPSPTKRTHFFDALMKTHLSTSIAVALITTLSGCGGGGGGSTATTTPPVPTTPPAVTADLQAAVTPTYATTSEEFGYFTAVNAFRAAEGLGPLNQNKFYDLASAAHANYEDLNAGTLGASHGEVSGYAGYTGGNPLERIQAAGGTATLASEELGVPDFIGAAGSGASFASGLINTVYHRASLMYQGLTDIGVSIGMNATSQPYSVSDLGYTTQQVNAGTYFGVYPTNGLTGVGLHAHLESPNPYPVGIDVTKQTGYPISVASQESTTLTVTTFTVTQQGATTPLSATLITSTDPNLTGSNNLAFLVANANFAPNTNYTVNFVGTISGAATGSATGIPVSQQWTFTTGTTTP